MRLITHTSQLTAHQHRIHTASVHMMVAQLSSTRVYSGGIDTWRQVVNYGLFCSEILCVLAYQLMGGQVYDILALYWYGPLAIVKIIAAVFLRTYLYILGECQRDFPRGFYLPNDKHSFNSGTILGKDPELGRHKQQKRIPRNLPLILT